jgi:hypothetical protein
MSGHTPGPWFVSNDNRKRIVVTIKGKELPWLIADTGFGPDVIGEANAAHIVACVNGYASLQAECERLREALSSIRERLEDNDSNGAWKLACAALSQVPHE